MSLVSPLNSMMRSAVPCMGRSPLRAMVGFVKVRPLSSQSAAETKDDKSFRQDYWMRRRDPERRKAAILGTERLELIDQTTLSNEEWKFHGYGERLQASWVYHKLDRDVSKDMELSFGVNLVLRYPSGLVPLAGNIMQPAQMQDRPTVQFRGQSDMRHTLLLTSPDSAVTNQDMESLHWMVANMDSEGEGGQTLVEYLPPTPPLGTGHSRYIFTLLMHSQKTEDLVGYARHGPIDTAQYAKQNKMAIVGAAFCQCQWDSSVTNVFTSILGYSQEPTYSPEL